LEAAQFIAGHRIGRAIEKLCQRLDLADSFLVLSLKLRFGMSCNMRRRRSLMGFST
jgi:hypothetical protein